MTVTEPPPPQGPQHPEHWARADVVLVAAFSVLGVYRLALLPFAPSLLATHTVLSEFLRGSTSAIITGGALVQAGQQSLAVVVLAGLAGTIMFDWLYWWAGARWGQWGIDMMLEGRPRSARLMMRLQALMGRWGSPILVISYLTPVPTALILVAAGWSGMSLRRFLVLDAIAGLLWTGLLVTLGYAIGHPAIRVAKAISHYGLLLGVAIIVLIVVNSVRRERRRG